MDLLRMSVRRVRAGLSMLPPGFLLSMAALACTAPASRSPRLAVAGMSDAGAPPAAQREQQARMPEPDASNAAIPTRKAASTEDEDAGTASASSEPSVDRCETLRPLGDVKPNTCSDGADTPATITVVNACSNDTITVHWVGYDCVEAEYGEVAPNASLELSTFLKHVWRLRDKATNALLHETSPLTDPETTVEFPGDGTGQRSEPVDPDADSSDAESCEALPDTKGSIECSIDGDLPTTLTFVNGCTARTISLHWVGYDCVEFPYDDIPPRGSTNRPTFVTHTWRVRDRDTGELLKEVRAESTTPTTITLP